MFPIIYLHLKLMLFHSYLYQKISYLTLNNSKIHHLCYIELPIYIKDNCSSLTFSNMSLIVFFYYFHIKPFFSNALPCFYKITTWNHILCHSHCICNIHYSMPPFSWYKYHITLKLKIFTWSLEEFYSLYILSFFC